MALPYDFGGLNGAIHVSATATLTVPDNMAIYAIVPQPSWTGKATPLDGYPWLNTTRASGGANVTKMAPVYGAYSEITTASGECDVYLKPIGSM